MPAPPPAAPRPAITPMAFVRAMVRAYERRGLDPSAALREAQITPAALRRADARITAAQMETISGLAMQQLDDEALGWFSRRLPWGSYGMLCRASISSPQLGLALQRWCRHHRLLTEDIVLHLDADGAAARLWIEERRDLGEMREIAGRKPGSGACTLATAMQMWLWTLEHLLSHTDADGNRLYASNRHGVTFALADALSWLLASRCQILDLLELEARGAANPVVAEGLEGTVDFLSDLCHIQSARAGGEAGRIAAELVFGYNRHPAWDSPGAPRSPSGSADLNP